MTIKGKWKKQIKRIKSVVNDELILHYEVGILLILLVISVTIAWFINNSESYFSDLILQAAEVKPSLYISNTLDGVEVGDDGQTSLIFKNDKQTKLMPGSEGTLIVYVQSANEDVIGCTIYLDELIPAFYDSDLSEDLQKELSNIVTDHIMFYYPDSDSDTEKYVHPITKNSGYPVYLNHEEKKAVTLYWIWPYSYSEIPNITDAENSEKNISYDVEDSKIGGYVKNIAFKFRFDPMLKETP